MRKAPRILKTAGALAALKLLVICVLWGTSVFGPASESGKPGHLHRWCGLFHSMVYPTEVSDEHVGDDK